MIDGRWMNCRSLCLGPWHLSIRNAKNAALSTSTRLHVYTSTHLDQATSQITRKLSYKYIQYIGQEVRLGSSRSSMQICKLLLLEVYTRSYVVYFRLQNARTRTRNRNRNRTRTQYQYQQGVHRKFSNFELEAIMLPIDAFLPKQMKLLFNFSKKIFFR